MSSLVRANLAFQLGLAIGDAAYGLIFLKGGEAEYPEKWGPYNRTCYAGPSSNYPNGPRYYFPTSYCGLGNQSLSAWDTLVGHTNETRSGFSIHDWYNWLGFLPRYYQRANYWRDPASTEPVPSGAPELVKKPAIAPQIFPWSRPLPFHDPINLPICQPLPNPEPIPYRDLARLRDDLPYRQRGNGVEIPTTFDPATDGWSSSVVVSDPSASSGAKADGNIRPGQKTEHVRRPPRRGEKERKFSGSKSVNRLFYYAAKAKDFGEDYEGWVNAVYYAIPKPYRGKGRKLSVWNKLEVIGRQIEHVQYGQLAVNMAQWYLGNQLGGRMEQLRGKVAKDLGLSKIQVKPIEFKDIAGLF